MIKLKDVAVSFLKSKAFTIIIFVVLLLVNITTVWLYDYAILPILYIDLVLSFIFLVFLLFEFRLYYKKSKQAFLVYQAANGYFEALPENSDYLTDLYFKSINILNNRITQNKILANKSKQNQNDYYSLWSHQIKVPISAIRLLSAEDELDISVLSQEIFKIEQYVDMALQYQRLEATENDLVIGCFDLEELVKKAVKRVRTLFIGKKLSIELVGLSKQIITDEKWFLFIIEQLLTNAVKYTRKGKVKIYLVETPSLSLVVEDTGIGIQPQDLPRVFEWGFTGINGRFENRSTGIGLSLCKKASSLLGSEIYLKSQLDKGTQAFLTLSLPETTKID